MIKERREVEGMMINLSLKERQNDNKMVLESSMLDINESIIAEQHVEEKPFTEI